VGRGTEGRGGGGHWGRQARGAEEGKGKSGITHGRGRMDKATPGRGVNVKKWPACACIGFV
jgi:hypothetical protein